VALTVEALSELAKHAGDAPAITIGGLTKRFDQIAVLRGVELACPPGKVTVLLGPSGCGKTTLLRTIAGLERPDDGSISIGEQTVTGPSAFVPPEQRRVGMVFQDWALFPHLTVAGNVGYGLSKQERRSGRIDEALDLVELGGLGDRNVTTLSGGQQQRVALARALAPRPSVLLLDEPFSNLDASLRVQVRQEVHQLLHALHITAVFVTHDQDEAFVLGDHIAVMHNGVVAQQGSPVALYTRPADRFVADFLGEATFISAKANGSTAESILGQARLHDDSHGAVDLVVRPEQVHLHADGDALIEVIEYYGHDHVAVVKLSDGQRLRVRGTGAPDVREGDLVRPCLNGTPLAAFPSS
jgi:iron(III) transport system ATP-binding protein